VSVGHRRHYRAVGSQRRAGIRVVVFVVVDVSGFHFVHNERTRRLHVVRLSFLVMTETERSVEDVVQLTILLLLSDDRSCRSTDNRSNLGVVIFEPDNLGTTYTVRQRTTEHYDTTVIIVNDSIFFIVF